MGEIILAFDLDGTLYDTLDKCFSLDQEVRQEFGYKPIDKKFYVEQFQSHDWKKFYRDLGIREKDIDKVIKLFENRFISIAPPELIPGAREALAESERVIGHENIFIITNETKEGVKKRFERDGLMRYMDRVDNPYDSKVQELNRLATSNGNKDRRVVYVGDLVSDGESCLEARKMGAENLKFYGIVHKYSMCSIGKMFDFVSMHPEFAKTLNSLNDIGEIWQER